MPVCLTAADAKLSEYIKDKKNARTTRDKFLADMGIVRSEVRGTPTA
jgi:hypothetical protein